MRRHRPSTSQKRLGKARKMRKAKNAKINKRKLVLLLKKGKIPAVVTIEMMEMVTKMTTNQKRPNQITTRKKILQKALRRKFRANKTLIVSETPMVRIKVPKKQSLLKKK